MREFLCCSSSFYAKGPIPIEPKDVCQVIEAYVQDKNSRNNNVIDSSIVRAQGAIACLKLCSSDKPGHALFILYALLNQTSYTIHRYRKGLNSKLIDNLDENFLSETNKQLTETFKVSSYQLNNLCNELTSAIETKNKLWTFNNGNERSELELDFIRICEKLENCKQEEKSAKSTSLFSFM